MLKMNKPKKHNVELWPEECETLMRNSMIASMCDDLLKSPRKRGDYLVLSLTAGELEELTGWVAAESNHAESREEEEALDNIFEGLESVLLGINMRDN